GRIDRRAVRDYLAFGYVPDPQSIFQSVRKLPPGHVLVWERGRDTRVSSYWSPARPEDTRIDEHEAVRELRRLLSEAVRYHLVADVPLGAFLSGGHDSSAIPTYLVSQLARRYVSVALSGDGGDELFGGYTRYLEAQRRREIRPSSVRHLVGAMAQRLPHSTIGRNRLLDLSRSRWGRYAATVANPLHVAEGGIAEQSLAASGEAFDALLRRWVDAADGRDYPTRMMLVDIMSYLPGDILTKVDRMSMAVSLEARVPLLDHHLAEFALSLPSGI